VEFSSNKACTLAKAAVAASQRIIITSYALTAENQGTSTLNATHVEEAAVPKQ
jgi:hypothetical protein